MDVDGIYYKMKMFYVFWHAYGSGTKIIYKQNSTKHKEKHQWCRVEQGNFFEQLVDMGFKRDCGVYLKALPYIRWEKRSRDRRIPSDGSQIQVEGNETRRKFWW
jgi:hypothetical protein